MAQRRPFGELCVRFTHASRPSIRVDEPLVNSDGSLFNQQPAPSEELGEGDIMPKVGVNEFVRRQTPESRFSHFNGTWEELATIVERWMELGATRPGDRDGIILVILPPDRFQSGVVEVTAETPLRATFEARRDGEAPFIQVVAVGGEKLAAKVVEVVLYRRDVLGKEATTPDADWEIISVNARPTLHVEPMTPMAMARNFLELPGGTRVEYTAEEFARAIIYWSQHAMLG